MKNPLVSIVICCYNRAHLLAQTMESIFEQHYSPVEIVVVDDGSTDNTPELMASYGNKVRYYWHKNQGTAATRTIGCRLAKGKFIAFQDDDDLMVPDRIVTLYQVLQRHPSAVLALGDWEEIDPEGRHTGIRSKFNIQVANEDPILIKDGYKAVLWPEVTPVPHTSLFRKEDGERIGWFDTRFFNAVEDTDFFARIGQLGPIVYVPKVMSYYRKGQSQHMGRRLLFTYNQVLLFEKHLRLMNSEQKNLKRRLQFRMLAVLNHIAIYQSNERKLPDAVSIHRLKECFFLLGFLDKIKYQWLTSVKLPIHRLIYR